MHISIEHKNSVRHLAFRRPPFMVGYLIKKHNGKEALFAILKIKGKSISESIAKWQGQPVVNSGPLNQANCGVAQERSLQLLIEEL